MLQKNLPPAKAFRVIFIRFWLDLLSIIKYLLQGTPKNAIAISKAHLHFLGKLTHNGRKSNSDDTQFNGSGLYNASIVWKYFGKGIKRFSDLKF
jgi:hypothetical protein